MTIPCVTTDVETLRTGNDANTIPGSLNIDVQDSELRQVETLIEDELKRLDDGPAKEAALYQIRTGGGLLRARLALASGHAFQCSTQYRTAAAAACELIHNASLVHDDLLDRDEFRRGKPAVWKQFGESVALCTGDLLLCSAFGVVSGIEERHQSQRLAQQLTRMTSRIIIGQSREVAPARHQLKPDLRLYLETTTAKTVPLIELPLMTGAVAAEADTETRATIQRLSGAIGLAYQIIDDLDDLANGYEFLHPFHAWHHHQPSGPENSPQRCCRAMQHALAALDRAERTLSMLETKLPAALGPRLRPLLAELQRRATVHRDRISYMVKT